VPIYDLLKNYAFNAEQAKAQQISDLAVAELMGLTDQ
jgi:hypothetical protein